jgi:hypothetical protein
MFCGMNAMYLDRENLFRHLYTEIKWCNEDQTMVIFRPLLCPCI